MAHFSLYEDNNSEGNIKTRQMTLFFHFIFRALAVGSIHFCYCKRSKFIFMWYFFGSVWSVKQLHFGQKLTSAGCNLFNVSLLERFDMPIYINQKSLMLNNDNFNLLLGKIVIRRDCLDLFFLYDIFWPSVRSIVQADQIPYNSQKLLGTVCN